MLVVVIGFGGLPWFKYFWMWAIWFKYFGTALTAGQFLKLIWEPNALVELEKGVPTLTQFKYHFHSRKKEQCTFSSTKIEHDETSQ